METLATELLKEVKASAKRWFIIAVVELVAIVALIILLFVVPAEVVEETTYTQDITDIQESDINQQMGEVYGKSNTNSDSESNR